MIRYYAFLLSSLSIIDCSAQSWCPPGATWTYNAWWPMAGYDRMSYVGDTVIDGYESQIIDRYRANQYPLPPPEGGWTEPIIEYTYAAILTRHADDVVYIRSDSNWDTLYWFGAAPGDHWYLNYLDMGSECAPVVVSDTGTTVFNGIPLKWVEIGGLPVYERIGCLWNMTMWCPNIIGDGPTGLRCYQDDEISIQFSETPCEIFVLIEELDNSPVSIYPNPGIDHFTLQLPPGNHDLKILDQLGRSVMQIDRISDQAVIGTASLPPGIYTLKITDRDGRSLHQHWVKQ